MREVLTVRVRIKETYEVHGLSLIHIFVENIYKHAVSVDNLITILVQVNKTEYKGQEMLCISIEDDGCLLYTSCSKCYPYHDACISNVS